MIGAECQAQSEANALRARQSYRPKEALQADRENEVRDGEIDMRGVTRLCVAGDERASRLIRGGMGLKETSEFAEEPGTTPGAPEIGAPPFANHTTNLRVAIRLAKRLLQVRG